MRPLGVKDCGFPVSKVRFHPTKPFFLCGSATDNSLLAFTWDDEGKLSQPTSLITDRRNGGIFDLAFHPSGDVVAVAENNQPLRLCSIQFTPADASILSTTDLAPPPKPPSIPTRPDLLPPGFQKLLDQWNAEAKKQDHPFAQVLFSPDGTRIAGHYCGGNQAVVVADYPSCSYQGRFWGGFECLRFHPEGTILATVDRGDASSELRFLWFSDPVQLSNVVIELPIYTGGLAFDWSGTQFATLGGLADCEISVYRFPDCSRKFATSLKYSLGDEAPWIVDKVSDALWGWADNLCFSGDGSRLFSPGPHGEIVALDVETGAIQEQWKVHDKYIMSLDDHPSLPFLVSGAADGKVCLWEFDHPATRSKPKGKDLSQDFLQYSSLHDSQKEIRRYIFHKGKKPLKKRPG